MRVMGGERECRSIKEFDSETACFKSCDYIRWDFHSRERSFFILTLVDSETKTIAQIVLNEEVAKALRDALNRVLQKRVESEEGEAKIEIESGVESVKIRKEHDVMFG